MKIFHFEIKKLLKDRVLILIFCLLLLFDGLALIGEYRDKYLFSDKNFSFKADRQYYDWLKSEFYGPLKIESGRRFMNLYWTYTANSGKPLKVFLAENDYLSTGDFRNDQKIMANTVLRRFRYSSEYHNYADKICERAEENLELYQPGQVEYTQNLDLLRRFKDRKIDYLGDIDRYNLQFNYKFSGFLSILALMALSLKLFSQESRHKVLNILRTSQLFENTLKAKIALLILLTVATPLTFIAIETLILSLLFDGSGSNLNLPLYALESFSASPFSFKISEYYFYYIAAKIVGLGVIAFLLLIIAGFKKNLLKAAAESTAAIIIFFLLFGLAETRNFLWLKYLNPLTAVFASELYLTCDYLAIGRCSMPAYRAALIFNSLCCLLLISFTYFKFRSLKAFTKNLAEVI